LAALVVPMDAAVHARVRAAAAPPSAAQRDPLGCVSGPKGLLFPAPAGRAARRTHARTRGAHAARQLIGACGRSRR
jgi:hypothetical protein